MDLMVALKCFAKNQDEKFYFNGFALYCMQIASSFAAVFNDEIHTLPPGLQHDELQALNNLALQSDAEIKKFRDRTMANIHADFTQLCRHLASTDTSASIRRELADARAQCAEWKNKCEVAERLNQELMRKIEQPIGEIKTGINQLQAQVARIAGGAAAAPAAPAPAAPAPAPPAPAPPPPPPPPAPGPAAAPAGAPPPLGQDFKDILSKCSELTKLTFGNAMPSEADLRFGNFSAISNFFDPLDTTVSGHLMDILDFCRASHCFFWTLGKFKKGNFAQLSTDGTYDTHKANIRGPNPRPNVAYAQLDTFLDTTFLGSRESIKEFRKVTQCVDFLDGEMFLKLLEVQPGMSFNPTNGPRIKLEINKKPGQNAQWKTSYLDCIETYHTMQHQLLFMFVAHLIRLIQMISRDDFAHRERVRNDLAKIKDIFSELFRETPVTNGLIFASNMETDLDTYFTFPDDKRNKYPVLLLHQGVYMKYASEKYPYLLDSTTKHLRVAIHTQSNQLICSTIDLNQNKTLSEFFEKCVDEAKK